jgi:hypothetical protein
MNNTSIWGKSRKSCTSSKGRTAAEPTCPRVHSEDDDTAWPR